jgi:hypothetical protein
MRLGLRVVVVLLGAVAWSHESAASVLLTKTFTCPLTGTTFEAKVEGSGTVFCQRLDLKPVGAISAPAPVPECPDDGFVLYRDPFSRRELKRLRPWIQSDHYQAVLRQESTHFRMAEMMKRLDQPAFDVGWAYLRASWQVEAEPVRYARYLEAALAAFTAGVEEIRGMKQENGALAIARLQTLAAEISRRLDRMTDAERWLESARPVVPQLPESDRQWYAAVETQVRARFSGKAYLTRSFAHSDSTVVCETLDEGR